MARKPGLPKKYAKFGFAKGWKLYKAAKRKAGTARKAVKKVVRKITRKRKPTTGVKKMAVRKRVTVRRAAKAPARRRRRPSVLNNKWIRTAVDAGLIGGSAVGSTALVNMAPVIKDRKTWEKALFQAVVGIFGMTMAKNLLLKKAFSGAAVGAAITMILPYIPEGYRFSTMGRGRTFTRNELNDLRTLGVPYPKTNGAACGVPIKSMGVPMQSLNGGRGKRAYAAAY